MYTQERLAYWRIAFFFVFPTEKTNGTREANDGAGLGGTFDDLKLPQACRHSPVAMSLLISMRRSKHRQDGDRHTLMKSSNIIPGEATNKNQRAERTTFNLFVFSLPLDRRHLHDTSRRGRMSEPYSLCLSLFPFLLFTFLPD